MFLDNILGAMIFQIIGASVRWSVKAIFLGIQGKEKPSFIEIYEGKEEDESHIFSSNAFLNAVIGFLFGFGMLCLIVWLGL